MVEGPADAGRTPAPENGKQEDDGEWCLSCEAPSGMHRFSIAQAIGLKLGVVYDCCPTASITFGTYSLPYGHSGLNDSLLGYVCEDESLETLVHIAS